MCQCVLAILRNEETCELHQYMMCIINIQMSKTIYLQSTLMKIKNNQHKSTFQNLACGQVEFGVETTPPRLQFEIQADPYLLRAVAPSDSAWRERLSGFSFGDYNSRLLT